VTMTAGGITMGTEFEVELDPRVEVSRADLMARQDAMMSAYAIMKPQYEARQAVRRIQEQLGQAQEMLTDDTPSEVRDEIQAIRKELTEIQRAMDPDPPRRRRRRPPPPPFDSFEGWTGRPTADAIFQLHRQWERLPDAVDRINIVITERMPALNQMLDQHGVRPSVGETIEVPKKP